MRTARCALTVAKLMERTNRSLAWLLRHARWQISRYKQQGNGMTNRPTVSIILMRSCHSRKSFLSGFSNQRSVLCKEEDVGKGDAVFIKGVGRTHRSQKHNPDLPDKTEDKHSETPRRQTTRMTLSTCVQVMVRRLG